MRGLEKIFSPVIVNGLSDTETQAIASEPPSGKRQRDLLENKIKKLSDGRSIFRGVMRSAAPQRISCHDLREVLQKPKKPTLAFVA